MCAVLIKIQQKKTCVLHKSPCLLLFYVRSVVSFLCFHILVLWSSRARGKKAETEDDLPWGHEGFEVSLRDFCSVFHCVEYSGEGRVI